MKRDLATLVLRLLVAAALLAAIAATVTAGRATFDARARLRTRYGEEAQVRHWQAEAERQAPVMAALGALPGHRLPALADLWRDAGGDPARPPEVTEHDAVALPDGWSMRRADIHFEDAPLARVGAFAAACERARPPWRVSGLRVTASGDAPGIGRASLSLSGWERKEAP